MAHQALYREWRPKVFDEVVEQKHAVFALRQSVISGQIAHAYLFSGTRGTGKTTLAKIFARAINCLDPRDGNPCNQCAICRGMLDGSLLDIVEMDAASNNSVDNIRRICDEVVFMPSQARFKVYIIDEVHMLSTGAFNALLKTLEEPPAHAVFILATTEPHRIPATILSRCQRYEFRRIPMAGLVSRLDEIAQADGIDISPDALQAIASLSDGAMRDAISLLDQAKASFAGRVERDDILSLAGVVQDEFMQQMAAALLDGDAPGLLELVDQLVMAGRDLSRFVTDLAQHLRNILVCQVSANPQLLVRASSDTLEGMRQLAGRVSGDELIVLIKGLSALLTDLRWAADARTALEIGLIRLMSAKTGSPVKLPMAAQAAAPQTADAPARTGQAAKPTALRQPDLPVQPAPASDAVAEDPGPVPPPLEEEFVPEPDTDVESEPEPMAAELSVTVAQPAPAAVAEPAVELVVAAIDVTSFWQRLLDQLMNDGHMTLYLFCRPIRPELDGSRLRLHFAAADQLNYAEISQPASLKVLKAAASRLAGHDMAVSVVLDGSGGSGAESPADTAPAADDWIVKIKKTADTLGIPVKVEE